MTIIDELCEAAAKDDAEKIEAILARPQKAPQTGFRFWGSNKNLDKANEDEAKELTSFSQPTRLVDQFNENDLTPLMVAAQKNAKKSVKTLIAAGANVNIRNKNDEIAIDFACPHLDSDLFTLLWPDNLSLTAWDIEISSIIRNVQNHFTLVHLLLGYGKYADIMSRVALTTKHLSGEKVTGETPLHWLLYNKELTEDLAIAILREYRKHGVDLCVTDNSRFNLLHMAVQLKKCDVIRFLLGLKILDIDAVNENGETALFICADHRHEHRELSYEIMGLLLEYSPNCSKITKSGETVLDIYNVNERLTDPEAIKGAIRLSALAELQKSVAMQALKSQTLAEQQKLMEDRISSLEKESALMRRLMKDLICQPVKNGDQPASPDSERPRSRSFS